MTNDAVKKAPGKAPQQPKPQREVTKFQYTLTKMKQTWVGYVMVAPFLLMFTVFTVVPVVLSILLSFTNFNMLQFPDFVFMDNYIRLFLDDDLFVKAFQNTMIFAVATGPASYVISFLVAWFINELPPKVRAFVTFIFYAPSISGNAYLVWQLFFQGDIYGYVNGWLLKMGLITQPIVFFKDTKYIVPLCIVVALWTSLGTSFLAFIAGLQGVDRTLYEAGAIDGIKNRWQELWYITLPSMRQILLFGAVLSITGSFGFGGIVTALCGYPSTDYVAWTLQHHLQEYMTTRFEFGYASAISLVLFFIMIGANVLVQKLLAKVGQ
ncbi:MAG: sugar ABC transporter permease [Clostridiales bacterium]|jgi:multiple sugar transport system permease protein|nr:sugar ABC transporter permease [Clostridiales bacterium]